MVAVGYVHGDPRKLDVAGYARGDIIAADATGILQPVAIGASTEILTVDLVQPEDVDWKPGGGSGGGTSVKIVDSGFITTGLIAAGPGPTQTPLGPVLTLAAAVGDVVGIVIEALIAAGGTNCIFDAATKNNITNVNFFSSGTNTPRFNGARPPWYFDAAAQFVSPNAIFYRLQAADIVNGSVSVQASAAGESGTRNINASTAFPLRTWLFNYGQGV